ncbi:protein phosphatase [Sordaria brevicollis]|uniref:Protein phosphatase n=1 Tax=Sordaria brevicollis TaxID=83679 RepID=A0AAE0PD56_SORBR|nr:protein phosphatase [Sordaria brevicollis]
MEEGRESGDGLSAIKAKCYQESRDLSRKVGKKSSEFACNQQSGPPQCRAIGAGTSSATAASGRQPYVCWQCLSRKEAGQHIALNARKARVASLSSLALASASWLASSSTSPTVRPTGRWDNTNNHNTLRLSHERRQGLSTSASLLDRKIIQISDDIADDFVLPLGPELRHLEEGQPLKPGDSPTIRQRLRQWELENPEPFNAIPSDFALPDRPVNAFTSKRSEHMLEMEHIDQDNSPAAVQVDDRDLIETHATPRVQAGDLLELMSAEWKIGVLAICLGNFNGIDHFYTVTGKWLASTDVKSGFIVKKFITNPADLQPVIDALPSTVGDMAIMVELDRIRAGPTREHGAGLITKMLEFQNAYREYYQNNLERLSNPHKHVPEQEQLMTLGEIAEYLLPPKLKHPSTGFPAAALYAVYYCLTLQDAYFRSLGQGATGPSSIIFHVIAKSDIENLHRVEGMVRDHYSPDLLDRRSRRDHDRLEPVLMQARLAIDHNRKQRQWSSHGMLGPTTRVLPASTYSWSQDALSVVRVIHMWAASDVFPLTSKYQWVGAAFLRALRRYEDVDVLDATVGWTFLQEIGWLMPWEIHARHRLRLPGLQINRAGGLLPSPEEQKPAELAEDVLAPLRQDFSGSTVYCIDSPDAKEIDDGVSLEKTDKEGEYWIHVHIADPTSRIRPDSPLAKRAALMTQTSYLPGHLDKMIADEAVVAEFSLAPGRPSLTFSARLNEEGTLLDHKVTPGRLGDIVYITPQDVAAAVGPMDAGIPKVEAPSLVLEVGTPPSAKEEPTRKMTKPDELSEQNVKDLEILSRLAAAIHKLRVQNGSVPVFLSSPEASFSLENARIEHTPSGFLACTNDPWIRVSYSNHGGQHPIVDDLMGTANQIAALWCYERGIPIPYRTNIAAAQNEEALRAFTQDVIYPQLIAGKRPTMEQRRTLRHLLGGHDIATMPSLIYTLGVDIYTKATSPLRRYSDLLVHWQIQAALLEEHKRRTSGSGGNNQTSLVIRKFNKYNIKPPMDDKQATQLGLPFTASQLEEKVFPHLRVRERHAKTLANLDGQTELILQALVRAWKFGEGAQGQVPDKFTYTVANVLNTSVQGRISYFDLSAEIDLENLSGFSLIGNVRIGDVMTVELVDVNVHMRKILVKPVEFVKRGPERMRLFAEEEMEHELEEEGGEYIDATAHEEVLEPEMK